MSIKIILHLVNSKRDIYGNCYYYVKLTSTKTGKTIRFVPDHGPNMEFYLKRLGFKWEQIEKTTEELKIREFKQIQNGLPYHDEKDLPKILKDLGVTIPKGKNI